MTLTLQAHDDSFAKKRMLAKKRGQSNKSKKIQQPQKNMNKNSNSKTKKNNSKKVKENG